MGENGTTTAVAQLREVIALLAGLTASGDEAEAIDLISALESIKSTCAAAQADQTLREPPRRVRRLGGLAQPVGVSLWWAA